MRTASRFAIAAALTGVALLAAGQDVTSQRLPGIVSVSAGSATNLDALRDWDALIDRMARDGNLALVSRRGDATLPTRTHEYLAQYNEGVPVLGGGVARQLDRGATVSLLGTLHEGIDIGITPAFSGAEAVARLEQAAGVPLAFGQAPRLGILPKPGPSYVLTYSAIMENAREYYIDALSGALVHTRVAVDFQQAAIGTGYGRGGGLRKMSTTRVTAREYIAVDILRPAEIITLSAGHDLPDYERLTASRMAGTVGWIDGDDMPKDRDNEWHQHAVVDTHVNMGIIYDYFYEVFNWSGIDGMNGRIFAVVNAPVRRTFAMYPPFGPEGNGVFVFGSNLGSSITGMETTAQEMMHGVTYAAVMARTGGAPMDDMAVSHSLGPRSFMWDGETHTCASAMLPVMVDPYAPAIDMEMLPAACDGGHFMLASDQGRAVREAWGDVMGEALDQRLGPPAASCRYQVGVYVGGSTIAGTNCTENRAARSIRRPHWTGNARHISGLVEFALAMDEDGAYHYSPFYFVGGEFQGFMEPDVRVLEQLEADDTVPLSHDAVLGGAYVNSTILSHVYYLAVEGGQAVGLDDLPGVQNDEDAIEMIEQVFFRAMTDLMPQAMSLEAAAGALRQSAADLAGGTAVQERIEEGLTAVGFPTPASE